MKKRIFCLILALVMVLSLAACAGSGNDNTENTKDTTTNTEGSEATTPVSGGEAELALITDANSIDDRGFNQFSWEGLKQYAEENGKTYTYYTPIDQSTQSYLSAIEGAVNNGAKLTIDILNPGRYNQGWSGWCRTIKLNHTTRRDRVAATAEDPSGALVNKGMGIVPREGSCLLDDRRCER